MDPISNVVKDLNDALTREAEGFDNLQKIHFDWLQTIAFQLNLFTEKEMEELKTRHEELQQPSSPQVTPKPKLNIPKPPTPTKLPVGAHSPSKAAAFQSSPNLLGSIPNGSAVRFVDDDSLLLGDSESGDEEIPPESNEYTDETETPFTLSGSLKMLSASAACFRSQWKEMVDEKEQEAPSFIKPIKFAFEEEEEVPEVYQMSDDSEVEDEGDDDDMYERNPIEIHGKIVPNWARSDNLMKDLKRQAKIDPDTIFVGFRWDCPLQEIFDVQKPKWDKRSDSGWWDPDRVTEEENQMFKQAVGLV